MKLLNFLYFYFTVSSLKIYMTATSVAAAFELKHVDFDILITQPIK